MEGSARRGRNNTAHTNAHTHTHIGAGRKETKERIKKWKDGKKGKRKEGRTKRKKQL
jgi:hypothetical protein